MLKLRVEARAVGTAAFRARLPRWSPIADRYAVLILVVAVLALGRRIPPVMIGIVLFGRDAQYRSDRPAYPPFQRQVFGPLG